MGMEILVEHFQGGVILGDGAVDLVWMGGIRGSQPDRDEKGHCAQ